MLREVQIDIRRQRAKAARFQIENLGKKRVFSDYRVTNPESGGQYTVSVKGFEVGDNGCTCPDFKSNTLGTCKHIEAVLDTLKDDLPAYLQKRRRPPSPGRRSRCTTASSCSSASTCRRATPTNSRSSRRRTSTKRECGRGAVSTRT